MQVIVTICTQNYQALFDLWMARIRRVTDLPVVVLALAGTTIQEKDGLEVVRVSNSGNPFPRELPDHACAEKLRLFHHLPAKVSQVLFLDIDLLVINDFWTGHGWFEKSLGAFVACPDLFVGYKERMEAEFQPFDPAFRMKYFPNGDFFYFNTGVFFASRRAHAEFFNQALRVWADYVRVVGRYPSIFDQNVFNYALISFGMDAEAMPVVNNCLRQYPSERCGGRLRLDGRDVNAYHFNGGDAVTKFNRWLAFERSLEEET